jgi:hypothetical protein
LSDKRRHHQDKEDQPNEAHAATPPSDTAEVARNGEDDGSRPALRSDPQFINPGWACFFYPARPIAFMPFSPLRLLWPRLSQRACRRARPSGTNAPVPAFVSLTASPRCPLHCSRK